MTGGIEIAENCKVSKVMVREVFQIVEGENKIRLRMPWLVHHLRLPGPQIQGRHDLHNHNHELNDNGNC